MAIFDDIHSDSFYFLTEAGEKLYPTMQENRKTKEINFRVGRSSSHNSLNHPDPEKRALEVNELKMFDYVINRGAFTRVFFPKTKNRTKNYRSCSSGDIIKVVINSEWKHYLTTNSRKISIQPNIFNEDNCEIQSQLKNLKSKTLPPEQLIEKLEHQSKIGKDGELFAINWEIQRLVNEDKATLEEAKLAVKHVALEASSLGYDIVSIYNGRKRFIEVKATKKNENTDFFFTKNEFHVLKNLKENAYIYRVVLDTENLFVINNPFDGKSTEDFIAIAFQTSLNFF